MKQESIKIREEAKARRKEIYRLVTEEGYTLTRIADLYGFTRTRALQLFNYGKRERNFELSKQSKPQ